MTTRLTLEEAAAELRTTERWLTDWLRAHPRDSKGEPFYTPVGRNKVFHQTDITRIEAALREKLQCRSILGRRGPAKRQITKSVDHTSDAAWKLAAELTNDPSLNSNSARSKSASNSTDSTQLPNLQKGRGQPS